MGLDLEKSWILHWSQVKEEHLKKKVVDVEDGYKVWKERTGGEKARERWEEEGQMKTIGSNMNK